MNAELLNSINSKVPLIGLTIALKNSISLNFDAAKFILNSSVSVLLKFDNIFEYIHCYSIY